MSESSLQKKGYMSSKDAGALLGYTHDYISRLCRHGKMSGIQKGREWFVTQEELDAFKSRHEIELKEKKIELSKKFSQIRRDAEAKKRKAREQQKVVFSQTLTTTEQSPVLRTFKTDKKSVKFVLPRELVAIAVLALLILIPNLFTPIPSTLQKNNQSSSTFSAQSTATESVASTFASVSGGYQHFFSVVGELPKETYYSLRSIGEGYLVFYVVQGEVLYESIGELNTLGAGVLRGYELIGESLVFGTKDILGIYARILNLDSNFQTSSRTVDVFSANVSGGFEYAKENAQKNIFEHGFFELVSVFNLVRTNISLNLLSIQLTLKDISSTMNAYVGSIFEFNLVKRDAQIKAIKLDK